MTREQRLQIERAWLARYDRCHQLAAQHPAERGTFLQHVARVLNVDDRLYHVSWPCGVYDGGARITETTERVIECPDCDGYGYWETDTSPRVCRGCRGSRLAVTYPDEEELDELVLEAVSLAQQTRYCEVCITREAGVQVSCVRTGRSWRTQAEAVAANEEINRPLSKSAAVIAAML